jgi:hypothetical protein
MKPHLFDPRDSLPLYMQKTASRRHNEDILLHFNQQHLQAKAPTCLLISPFQSRNSKHRRKAKTYRLQHRQAHLLLAYHHPWLNSMK